MIWIIIGTLAAVLTGLQFLPQVFKSIKTKKLEDISTGTYGMIVTTSTLWLFHGFHVSDIYIIGANSLILVSAIITLVLKVLYK